MGSCHGSVGCAAAHTTSGPRFESRQLLGLLNISVPIVTCKNETKPKEIWNSPRQPRFHEKMESSWDQTHDLSLVIMTMLSTGLPPKLKLANWPSSVTRQFSKSMEYTGVWMLRYVWYFKVSAWYLILWCIRYRAQIRTRVIHDTSEFSLVVGFQLSTRLPRKAQLFDVWEVEDLQAISWRYSMWMLRILWGNVSWF